MCSARENIPTAAYARHSDKAAALADLARFGVPVVIKADGLAAGKGVIIAETASEARDAIEHMFEGGFGDAIDLTSISTSESPSVRPNFASIIGCAIAARRESSASLR